MASLRKISGSRVWVACFRDSNRKLFQRSTTILDTGTPAERAEKRRQAQAVADHFEQAARGEHTSQNGVIAATNDLLRRIGRPEQTVPTVKAFLDAWLKRQQGNVAPRTEDKYTQVVAAFAEKNGTKFMAGVTVDDIARFKDDALASGVTRSTVAGYMKILRMPFREAMAAGVIPVNPTALVKVRRVSPLRRGTFTLAEIKALLAAADDEWKTAIFIGLFTGLRLGDVINMKRSDLSADMTFLCVKPSKRQDREAAPLIVPFHDELQRHLLRCCGSLTSADYLMPSLQKKDISGRNGLSFDFLRLIELAGITNKPTKEKNGKGRAFHRLTFHALRHTFNSLLAVGGVPQELRMKLMDHRSLRVNDGYTHVELETLKEAVRTLPQLTA